MKEKSFIYRLAEFIVSKRVFFALVFVALIVFSCFSIGWVDVETDIAKLLGESAESKRGALLMEEEFTTYGTANIMVDYIAYGAACDLCEELRAVEGVTSVAFDGSEQHFKDHAALYQVTFCGTTDDPRSVSAMEKVREIVGHYASYIDSEVGNSVANVIGSEMIVVGILVAIVVVAVLIFTSSTYAEILVLILTFLTAAVINMGTNFMMGTISFVSSSVSIVLQLALSVDYAIILCNRYKESHETRPIREAVVHALSEAIPEIFASSLTTIAGLFAMTFMDMQLGADMGRCLIKSIAIALLSVFVFMPALLVAFGGLMDRTKHRNFVPRISFVGKFAYATRFVLPPLFIAVVLFAYHSFGTVSYAYSAEIDNSVTKSEQAIAQEKIYGTFGRDNMIAVILPAGDYQSEKALLEDLAACDGVKRTLGLATIEVSEGLTLADSVSAEEFAELAQIDSISSRALLAYFAAGQGDYYAATSNLSGYRAPLIDLFLFLHDKAVTGEVELPAEQLQMVNDLYAQLADAKLQLQSEHYSRILIYLAFPAQSEESAAFLEKAHALAAQYYPADEVVMTGYAVMAVDCERMFSKDLATVGIVSIGLVMLILLFAFRSIGMPLLLIMTIQGSIWINFAIPALRGDYVFFMTYLIVSAIQMGANIDYAIVISSRYLSLRGTMDHRSAMIETMNLSFPTVITSGSMMVMSGILIWRRVSYSIISEMGHYIGVGTIITLLLVHFILPQVLLLGDGIISATTLRLKRSLRFASILRGTRKLGAALFAAASVAAIVITALCFRSASLETAAAEEENRALLREAETLLVSAQELDLAQERYNDLTYSFAEQLVTDEVGSEQLAEGEAEYEAGEQQLAEGQAQYDEGAAELEAARAQLAAGNRKYREGLAQYEAGQQALAEGKAQLAEGQAQYDAGEQQLAEAKAQYAAAEAALGAVAPVYNSVMPAYNEYQSLLSQYNAAVAEGNDAEAAALAFRVAAARALFESQLGGYSVSSLISDYQSAQAQLADAQAQIAEGEAQLAAAKAELDAGYAAVADAEAQLADAEQQLAKAKAQLNSGAAQIAAGEEQLDEAKGQLDEGYEQLAEAAEQLDEGRDTLAANREALDSSLAELDSYADRRERLLAGLALLMSDADISAAMGNGSTYSGICSYAVRHIEQRLDDLEFHHTCCIVSALLILFAGLFGLAGALLWAFGKGTLLAGAFSGYSAFLAVLGSLFWRFTCSAFCLHPYILGLVLAAVAVLCSSLLIRSRDAVSA